MEVRIAAPNVVPGRRRFLRGAALGGRAAMLAAVNDGVRAAGDPIPVGQAAPLTGFAAADGVKFKNGLTLASGEINVPRGILGRPLDTLAAKAKAIRIGDLQDRATEMGALAAVSGIMMSSLSVLLSNMGADPMLKAFVICVVAGLGNVCGAVAAAIILGLLEAIIQYELGVQYSFVILLPKGLVGLFSRFR